MALKDLTKIVQETITSKTVEHPEVIENDIINEDVESVDLGALIDEFFEEKSIIDSHKKRVDALNARIKEVMQYRNITDFETDKNTATYSVSQRTNLVEDLILTKLKSIGAEDLIKLKEVPDIDLIEDRIYHNEFDATQLADCMEIKEVVTLKVKSKKKKGGKR